MSSLLTHMYTNEHAKHVRKMRKRKIYDVIVLFPRSMPRLQRQNQIAFSSDVTEIFKYLENQLITG